MKTVRLPDYVKAASAISLDKCKKRNDNPATIVQYVQTGYDEA